MTRARAGAHAFCDARLLELRQRRQDVELQPPGWRGAVDPFPEADEGHTHRLQLIEQRHEMLEAAPEPIQPPHHQDIDPSAPGVLDQPVERGAPIPCTRDAVIDVLDRGWPAPGVDVPAQFGELVLGFLVEGRDASIERGPHASTPDSLKL